MSCANVFKYGERQDGIYTIDPDGLGAFKVWCDMTSDRGGWTVFQRRQDKSEDFYRSWYDYRNGFGKLNGNFWLGLDKIHRLTKSGQNVLRVDLADFDNTTAYAKYGTFDIASVSNSYTLAVGGYSGKHGFRDTFYIIKH
jgi:ficolin